MKKRLLVGLLIAVTVAMSVFTACSTESTTSTAQPVNTTSQAATSTAAPQASTTGAQANWWDKLGTPQYGGTLTVATDQLNTISLDPANPMGSQYQYWAESLFAPSWTVNRNTWSFRTGYIPAEYYQGWLAKSWTQVDPTTINVSLRQGVHWQNKPPVNGREFTADDVVYNMDRAIGNGDGFTEPNPFYSGMIPDISQVTAVDKYTVQFKLKASNIWTINEVLTGGGLTFAAPEWIKEYGAKSIAALGGGGPGGPPGGAPPPGGSSSSSTTTNGSGGGNAAAGGATGDWKTAVGTGAWILTDFVPGSSLTVSKNTDYWGYDERYPQNKLPYLDTYRNIAIPDTTTMLAALRTAKIDMPSSGPAGASWQEVQSLIKTNPELTQIPGTAGSEGSIVLRCDQKPFTDIRVREALQLAIDNKTMAQSIGGGWASDIGLTAGLVNPAYTGFCIPYNQWPADLQAQYSYNPTKAKELLSEAGFPDGFKTTMVMDASSNSAAAQAIKSYFNDIGVQMDIQLMDRPTWMTYVMSGKADQMIGFTPDTAMGNPPLEAVMRRTSQDQQNYAHNNDPQYEALYQKAANAATMEEAQQAVINADMYALKQHWAVQGYMAVGTPTVYWPWVKGYSGENLMGSAYQFFFSRWWIDQSMKKQMGH